MKGGDIPETDIAAFLCLESCLIMSVDLENAIKWTILDIFGRIITKSNILNLRYNLNLWQ